MPTKDYYAPILKNWIYPLSQKVRGRNYPAMFREACRIQKLSGEEIRDLQFNKLKIILQHAWDSVPHYRDVFNKAGLEPQDIRSLEDLQLIPVLTKSDIREAPQRFISSNPRTRALTFKTSGTSGQPQAFQLDQSAITAGLVSRFRALEWWGIQLGDRHIEIRDRYDDTLMFPDLRTRIKTHYSGPFKDLVINRRVLSPYDMGDQKLEQYLGLMDRFRPSYLFGYPSSIHYMADYIQKKSYQGSRFRLKLVVSMGEMLHRNHADAFKQVFNCPTANEYGSTEFSVIAYSCPCGRMHSMDDFLIMEIEKPDPEDMYGEVIVTGLENFASPLIRYKIGDLALPGRGEQECPLGINLSSFERIIGREFDIMHLPGGKITSSMVIESIMWELEGVRRYQVEQTSPGSFIFTIVLDSEGNNNYIEDKIRARMSRPLGIRDIKFVYVSEIPPDASGKFQYVRTFKI